MKGKLTKVMLVAMMLVTVFGLAASLATVSSTATVSAANDKWSRMNLPTTLDYQMFPDSQIWDLTAADDGTLFALVEDTTGAQDIIANGAAATEWDGLRWNIFPAYSDVAVFKSSDGGCSWSLCYHLPSSEMGVPVAIVPQPGYVDSDSSNNTVFLATGVRYNTVAGGGDAFGNYLGQRGVAPVAGTPGVGNLYRALDGCNFTRVTPNCPGVADGGSITCLDVVSCDVCATGCQDSNMALVGVSAMQVASHLTASTGEGLYSWNANGIAMWNDMQLSNTMQAPPMPGTLPAGSGLNVLAVYGSRNYATDKLIVAVVNARTDAVGNAAIAGPSGGLYGVGTFVCFWDGNDGYWGGDVNSPTNVQRETGLVPTWIGNFPGAAVIETGTDFNNVGSCYVFVGLDGSNIAAPPALPSNDTVWRIRGLPTVTGPSTSTNCNVDALLYDAALPGGARGGRISDLMLKGDVGNAQTPLYVACDYPISQAQVVSVTGLTVWPSPVPSFKPMSGMWPTYVTNAAGTVFAAGGGDGFTTSGVHKMYDSSKGPVFNGRGILDDIAQSETIPGYVSTMDVNAGTTEWCLVEALNQEVSPTYNTDGLIYTTTWSEWVRDLSLWRLTDGCWERIMYEDIRLPSNQRFESKAMLTTAVQFIFANTERGTGEIWWPRVVPQFSTDGSVFVLGGRNTWAGAQVAAIEMLWYSADKGNSWGSVPQMPVGAAQNTLIVGNGLSESGWIPVDSNHLLLGDVAGRIYRTDNRGASWTPGVLTTTTTEINTIEVSPIYSITGAAGTDQVVLVGSYDAASQEDEVWISQDACAEKILEHVGDELYAVPNNWAGIVNLGGTVVQFDKNWATNHFAYAASGGWLDRWELVGTGSGIGDMTRIDYTDVNVGRIEINLDDPYAAAWDHLWDADDYMRISPTPQTVTGMTQGDSVYRVALPSAIETGADGTVYVTFSVWDSTYNNGNVIGLLFGPGDNPSPNAGSSSSGRFTMSGALRCLDATEADAEFEVCMDGRGPWDGLWLGAAVPGSTQLISLTWDWKEWDWKLAFWKDTLAGSGPAASAPADGATGVGSIMADTSISAPVSWQAQTSATLYEWQVSEDAAFSNPKSGTTSGTTVTVPGLQAQTTYYWRVRTVEPMLGRWSTVQEFTTVPGGDTGAPKAGAPADGSTISDTTPLFTWGKIASATNYELQVATSPSFGTSDVVIDKTLGDVSAFEADKELANGTYYWRVRGTNPATDTESPWSFGSFTLDTEAEGEGTPVWVWVLIIVGVVLAIIVLVLILRTRRPV